MKLHPIIIFIIICGILGLLSAVVIYITTLYPSTTTLPTTSSDNNGAISSEPSPELSSKPLPSPSSEPFSIIGIKSQDYKGGNVIDIPNMFYNNNGNMNADFRMVDSASNIIPISFNKNGRNYFHIKSSKYDKPRIGFKFNRILINTNVKLQRREGKDIQNNLWRDVDTQTVNNKQIIILIGGTKP